MKFNRQIINVNLLGTIHAQCPIHIIYCFSSHNSWNSESSDSESDETENRRPPPPSKSLNRRAAQKAKEKARVRKKHISESSDNSSFDSDDNRRYVSLKFDKKKERERCKNQIPVITY